MCLKCSFYLFRVCKKKTCWTSRTIWRQEVPHSARLQNSCLIMPYHLYRTLKDIRHTRNYLQWVRLAWIFVYEIQCEKKARRSYANSIGPSQPMHLHSLIRPCWYTTLYIYQLRILFFQVHATHSQTRLVDIAAVQLSDVHIIHVFHLCSCSKLPLMYHSK